MAKQMSKAELVAELAVLAESNKAQSDRFLRALAAIAYREAANGFTIPGICKLEVADRQARKCRQPQSGAWILIGARKALRVRAVKKAKDSVTPRPAGLVTILESTPDVESDTVEKSAPRGMTAFMAFVCPACAQEIEATADLAGRHSECPACGVQFTVPHSASAQPGLPAAATPAGGAGSPAVALPLISFRCAHCGQEIEASPDMAGLESECPSCVRGIRVPMVSESVTSAEAFAAAGFDMETVNAMKSRTIRIEIPEDIGV